MVVQKIGITPVIEQDLSLYAGWMPPIMLDVKDPSIKWKGASIPGDLWMQIKAFIQWSWEKHAQESQLRLYYNEDNNEWAAIVLPQYCHDPLNTKEFSTHKDKETSYAPIQSESWTAIGTVHHHCELSAFQSSTDEANERKQDGIHITLGHIDKDTWNIHARIVYRGLTYKPQDLKQYLPEVNDENSSCLKAPATTVAFPKEWMDRICEPPPYSPMNVYGFNKQLTYSNNRSANYYKGFGNSQSRRSYGGSVWNEEFYACDELVAECPWDIAYANKREELPSTKSIAACAFTVKCALMLSEMIREARLHAPAGKIAEALAPVIAILEEHPEVEMPEQVFNPTEMARQYQTRLEDRADAYRANHKIMKTMSYEDRKAFLDDPTSSTPTNHEPSFFEDGGYGTDDPEYWHHRNK